jgi:hypothetical protein
VTDLRWPELKVVRRPPMLARTPTSGEWDPGRGAAASGLGLASLAIDAAPLKPLSNHASSPQETPASLGAALVDLAPAESCAAAVLLNKLLLRARHCCHGHAPQTSPRCYCWVQQRGRGGGGLHACCRRSRDTD